MSRRLTLLGLVVLVVSSQLAVLSGDEALRPVVLVAGGGGGLVLLAVGLAGRTVEWLAGDPRGHALVGVAPWMAGVGAALLLALELLVLIVPGALSAGSVWRSPLVVFWAALALAGIGAIGIAAASGCSIVSGRRSRRDAPGSRGWTREGRWAHAPSRAGRDRIDHRGPSATHPVPPTPLASSTRSRRKLRIEPRRPGSAPPAGAGRVSTGVAARMGPNSAGVQLQRLDAAERPGEAIVGVVVDEAEARAIRLRAADLDAPDPERRGATFPTTHVLDGVPAAGQQQPPNG